MRNALTIRQQTSVTGAEQTHYTQTVAWNPLIVTSQKFGQYSNARCKEGRRIVYLRREGAHVQEC
jgi:hypothetical protein